MNDLTQAALAKELVFWAATAKGWKWTWQRCGCYAYQKCLVHSTNPDHLAASVPSATNVSPLRIAPRYLAGKASINSSRPDSRHVPHLSARCAKAFRLGSSPATAYLVRI